MRRTVRIMSKDRELLFAAHRHDALFRENFDALDFRIGRFSVRHALADPADEQAIIIGIGLEPLNPKNQTPNPSTATTALDTSTSSSTVGPSPNDPLAS